MKDIDLKFLFHNIQVEIITNTELEFPAVTLCNTNKLRRSVIMKSRHRQVLSLDNLEPLAYYGNA